MKLLTTAISISIICHSSAVRADTDFPSMVKSRTKRVVGGFPVAIESFPFVVSLRAPKTGNHFCGGTILNPLVILTAAHCVARFPINSTSVQVGSDLVQPPSPRRFDVADAIVHADYNGNSTDKSYLIKNDVGLIRLKSPIATDNTDASSVGKAALPRSVKLLGRNETVPGGSKATVVGWGAIDEPGEDGARPDEVLKQLANGTWVTESLRPARLMAAEVSTVSSERCSRNYYGERFEEDRLCAYYPGRDSCDGDSGGPLMVGSAQAGIVSTGEDCAERDSPGIYTSVAFFRDWIDRNVELLLARAET